MVFSSEQFNQTWVKAACLVLNHLLAQQPNAQEALRAVHGKTLSVAVGAVNGVFLITEPGQFASAPLGQSADTCIALPWAVVLNNMANVAALRRQVQLQGDVDLAQTVVGVLSALRWDVEMDLARVLGEVPAVWLVRILKTTGTTLQQVFFGTVNALRDYLVHERAVLPSLTEHEAFRLQLDTLRDSLARLEKRVDGLYARNLHGRG